MKVEITVPSPGESITEILIAEWLVGDGDHVEENQDIVEIDSDKATLSIAAKATGKLKILVHEGETVEIDSVIGHIDTKAKGKKTKVTKEKDQEVKKVKFPRKKLKPPKKQIKDQDREVEVLKKGK